MANEEKKIKVLNDMNFNGNNIENASIDGISNNITNVVKSVRIQGASPVLSSQNTTQSTTLSTTVSLADSYGDTKNPYGSKTKNYVLAAPNSTNGIPTFRLLDKSDIPLASETAVNGGTTTSLVTTGEKYNWNNKQNALTTQTAYTNKGSATKVPKITTNTLGQVTSITEVTITQPTVNNKTITIQKNSTTVDSFTLNQSTDKSINIIVPTTLSELTNDSGYTTNTGTVTSVRVQATSPVQSSTSSEQTSSLNTTISLADNYGDTKNPYGSKNANMVLASPNSTNGIPGFRTLVKADIPLVSEAAVLGGTTTSLVTTGEKYTWNSKQDALTTQTIYSAKGSATKVPQITTNSLGQVTGITEVTITQPTVNNKTITIQKNSTNVDSFTLNQSTDKSINIIVPTKTSDITNDSGFLTSHQNIKILKTDNTTTQTVSTSEAIVGNGTINLHKVSKTGSYSDLLDKPTIPIVNNNTITIQKNSATVDSFTLNQSTDKIINIPVPNTTSTVISGNSDALTSGGAFTALATKQNKILAFTNKTASSWVIDSTYTNYQYKCDLSCPGVTSNMFAEVIFGPDEFDSGNYANICSTDNNVVTIYSKVDTTIVVPTILVMEI